MARRSIVQIARTMPWQVRGGMETHAWQLAQAWRRRGWEVDVLTTSFDKPTHVEDRDGVRIHYLRHLPRNRHEVPQWRWWHRFAARARDYAVAHKVRADVIHSESAYGHALFAHMRRHSPSTACVYTLHGTTLQVYNETGRRQLLKQVKAWHPRAIGQWAYVKMQVGIERRRHFPRAHRIVSVGEQLRDHLERDYHVPAQRLDVIGNGVQAPRLSVDRAHLRVQLGLPSDAVILLYLGRVEASKGVDRIWPQLEQDPRSRLLVAGEGSDTKRLKDLAQKLRNPAAVRFLGPVDDDLKQRLLVAADVLLLPSDAEGQPIVLIESLAAGTPVYATRAWVPQELAPLVATGTDVPEGVRRALQLRPTVEARAADVSRRYSWDEVAKRYEAVFDRAAL